MLRSICAEHDNYETAELTGQFYSSVVARRPRRLYQRRGKRLGSGARATPTVSEGIDGARNVHLGAIA